MRRFLHDLVMDRARGSHAGTAALRAGALRWSYRELGEAVTAAARGMAAFGIGRGDRVAIYLDKRLETVAAIFGASAAGAVVVPCNPVLKSRQVCHILADSEARLLVTSSARFAALGAEARCGALESVICIDSAPKDAPPTLRAADWTAFLAAGADADVDVPGPAVETEIAAIFYTSGSTGRPKGVVLSHRNLVAGAESVVSYLGPSQEDRVLALLPLSFDAGFSQATTAFLAGAELVLTSYLLARDVPGLCAETGITLLTGVPPLWMQLLEADWPADARHAMRRVASTGGRMPHATLRGLRALFPRAEVFLMYGMTEAFRSTYLDPAELDRRPESIGKAIPNAEILVLRPDGSPAGPGEDGELVHCGPLVARGYWKDPEATAHRFRPAPARPGGLALPEPAVFSGDIVRTDEAGFLYFVGRTDDMIKTSGYRVSPTEVEEVLFETGLVREAAAVGLAHATLGQEIAVAAVPAGDGPLATDALRAACMQQLPRYMVPARLVAYSALPRSPNGKIDRRKLAAELADAPQQARA